VVGFLQKSMRLGHDFRPLGRCSILISAILGEILLWVEGKRNGL
jgi:hypothetical protein